MVALKTSFGEKLLLLDFAIIKAQGRFKPMVDDAGEIKFIFHEYDLQFCLVEISGIELALFVLGHDHIQSFELDGHIG